MHVTLNGEMLYLWRGVDHEGEVLESYGTKKHVWTTPAVQEHFLQR